MPLTLTLSPGGGGFAGIGDGLVHATLTWFESTKAPLTVPSADTMSVPTTAPVYVNDT